MLSRNSLLVFILLIAFAAPVIAAEAGPCAVTPIRPDPKRVNIFTPDQEIYLGEIFSTLENEDLQTIDDAALTAYLNTLGQRLVKKLPETNLNFRFYVYDTDRANAFSIAGGRVYVSRKLINFTHSEDELAGVIAHELGHIVTHQTALVYSKIFKEKIGVTSFSSREDLMEKFHEMLESKKSITISVDDEQKQADQVGAEVLVRAGYRAEALAEFWDRFTENKGKRGNWLSDLFGGMSENTKRYRAMLRQLPTLPTECVDKRDPGTEVAYKEWQHNLVSYDRHNRAEHIPGLLSKRTIEPPLQDQLHTLRFSKDGKYVVAQDNGTIYVLTRDPFKVKFSIPAEGAYPAKFTADSKSLTFYSPDLRAEVWDLESGTLSHAYDLHLAHGCMQTALSPDAKTLACVGDNEDLFVIDTATNEHLFEKKDIRPVDVAVTQSSSRYKVEVKIKYVNLAFSPDGKYLVLAGTNKTIGIDIANKREIQLGPGVKQAVKHAFTFLDEQRLFGLTDDNGNSAVITTFPEGRVLDQLEFGGAIPASVSKGDYVLMRPIKDFEVGVLDLKSKQIVRANKKPAMDIYGDLAISEIGTGELGLFGASAVPIARAQLPKGRLAGLRYSGISEDFQWLAISGEERGGIWNLNSGQRVYNVKSFRGAYFGPDGAYIDFPKQEKVERAIAKLNLTQQGMTLTSKLGAGRFYDHGHYLLKWNKRNKEEEKEEEKTMERFNRYRYEGETIKLRDFDGDNEQRDELEIIDMSSGKSLWKRKFSGDLPFVYTNDDAGVVAFMWELWQPGAKSEVEKIPSLAKVSTKMLDHVIQLVDLNTGEVLGGMIFPTNEGTVKPRRVHATRNMIVVSDSFGRVLVYDTKTGACTGKLFGEVYDLATDSKDLLIRRSPYDFTLYDASTMKVKAEYSFPAQLKQIRFSAKGDRLLVLSSDQTAYMIDTTNTSQEGAK